MGRLKIRKEVSAGGATSISTFTYNGNTVTKTGTSISTGEAVVDIKTYNEQGDLIKRSVPSINRNNSYKFTYEYDKNKNLVKKIVSRLQDDGSYTTQYLYEYTWKAFTIPESYLCKRKPESLEAKGCALYSSEIMAEK